MKTPTTGFSLSVILLWCLLLVSNHANAAKAISQPVTFTQPDGSLLTVLLRGDENANWYTTTDGVILKRDGNIFFIAAIDSDGNITSTGITAHNKDLRSGDEQIAVIAQRNTPFYNSMSSKAKSATMAREAITTANPSFFPHTGKPKAVVILAEFNDVKFSLTNPQQQFNDYFNGDAISATFGTEPYQNYTSIKQYFSTISKGKFEPEFTVVGPVTLPNDMAYYGGSNDYASDENVSALLKSAISQTCSTVNYSSAEYDSDSDGRVDLVYVIYAGYGQNTGGPNESIWAKSGTINVSINGVAFGRYCTSSELNLYENFWNRKNGGIPCINGIGVACHEFSHAMGLPDTYPTNSAAYADNQEMEYWDLMDGGEYVKYGYRPSAYTAWEREVMGWQEIETLTNMRKKITIGASLDGGECFRILNDADENEYLILENIQQQGINGDMPGHGLLVYHVRWPYSYVSMYNLINNVKGKPDMAVVPADGLLMSTYFCESTASYTKNMAGDTFPGTSNVTTLNNTQELPNFTWYTGTEKVNKALANISESMTDGTITFDFIDDFATGIGMTSLQIDNTTDRRIYTIDGRYVGSSPDNLPRGLYIMGGKMIIKK